MSPAFTVKLTIAYDGTAYKGWQLQTNGNTIQSELEKALQSVYKKNIRAYCSGRTDAGVHALGQVAHYKTHTKIPAKKIPVILNSFLPNDISVLKASYQKNSFHAQYDAKRKLYEYFILNSRERDPFAERYATRVPYKLDAAAMKRAAQYLLGKHDFKAFQASDNKERTSVRKITHASVAKKGNRITISLEANGFLYNMVRNIAGTLIDVGRGYTKSSGMKGILEGKDRTKAGPTAPAKGLFLVKVKY